LKNTKMLAFARVSRAGRMAGAALLLVAPLHAQQRTSLCPAIPSGRLTPIEVVRYLADDGLEGRLAGSPGERCAGDFIAARFRGAGLEPAGDSGTFFQSLRLASALNPHAPAGIGRNVVGLLRGTAATAATPVVVIGAHYDHLGRGGFGSLAPEQTDAVHNGADDNASGVAAMIRAAELLVENRPAASVLFVAFTGEESGLLGSAHFVEHSGVAPQRIRAMLNLDMVGRLGANPLIVYGVGTATEWRTLLERISSELGVVLAYQADGFGPSDHTSFYAREIPVLHFFTNTHGDYHRPSDDWDRVDADGLEKVAAVVAGVGRRLAAENVTITLQRGAGAPPSTTGRSSTYLGSIPDFTPVERGVLLGGVSPGSPAEKAGLRRGDVIIALGDHEVNDLQGLTDALNAQKPGDHVRVKLLREGRELRIDVTLGNRSARS
jgi:hypothetical protein